MNVDNQTPDAVQGGTAAPVAADTTSQVPAKAPRSDAEAEAMERDAAAKAKPDGEPDKPADNESGKPDGNKKPNSTRLYIDRINEERRALRNQIAERDLELERLRRGGAAPARADAPAPGAASTESGFNEPEPTLEDFDFDNAEWMKAWTKWNTNKTAAESKALSERTQSREQLQKTFDSYEERIAEFASEHDDFQEVVTSIQYPIPDAVQLAIMKHERGVEIAYYLGKNDDEAFNLASVNPALAEKAVERLASRMAAAQSKAPLAQDPAPQAQSAPDVPGLKPTDKPISKAPAPTPTLSGKSPGDVPDEKLTDDEWYAKERERERKR
jgi:hypothetical protein